VHNELAVWRARLSAQNIELLTDAFYFFSVGKIKIMENLPEKIYLQFKKPDEISEKTDFYDLYSNDEVKLCIARQDDTDVCYVRQDIEDDQYIIDDNLIDLVEKSLNSYRRDMFFAGKNLAKKADITRNEAIGIIEMIDNYRKLVI